MAMPTQTRLRHFFPGLLPSGAPAIPFRGVPAVLFRQNAHHCRRRDELPSRPVPVEQGQRGTDGRNGGAVRLSAAASHAERLAMGSWCGLCVGRMRVKTDLEQEIWSECARLLANCVIFHSASILSEFLAQKDRQNDVSLAERIKRISPVNWRHASISTGNIRSVTSTRSLICWRCSVPWMELKRLLARMTSCRMSRALSCPDERFGSVLW
jgi:hypothetical protein